MPPTRTRYGLRRCASRRRREAGDLDDAVAGAVAPVSSTPSCRRCRRRSSVPCRWEMASSTMWSVVNFGRRPRRRPSSPGRRRALSPLPRSEHGGEVAAPTEVVCPTGATMLPRSLSVSLMGVSMWPPLDTAGASPGESEGRTIVRSAWFRRRHLDTGAIHPASSLSGHTKAPLTAAVPAGQHRHKTPAE